MRFLLIFSVLALSLCSTAIAAPQAQEQVDGFKSIFNGTDLSGWDGDSRLWSVKDGVIRGETTPEKKANRNTFLIWQGGNIADFELKLSFRCNATNNSGIQYRSRHITEGAANKWVVRGYQHEIRNENVVPNVPSFIYDEGGKRGRICLAGEEAVWTAEGKRVVETFMSAEEIKSLMKIDQWNEVRILAEGQRLQHFLNGKRILDCTDKHPELSLSEGVLALQLHAGKPMWVEFKDIVLRKIENDASSGSARLNVWPGLAPGETESKTGDEVSGPNNANKSDVTRVENITQPTFTVHRPEKPNGSGMLILPGGGFGRVVPDLEGTEAAEWLNQHGVTAFVLNYRTANSGEKRWEKAVQDAQRAMALIRSRAQEWNLKEDRIGLLGFSAGGQAAARVLASDGKHSYEKVDETDNVSFRPDFSVLVYPWKMYDAEEDSLAEGISVPKNCPPTFIVHTHDDQSSSLGAVLFYADLKRANVPSELHVYGNGGHGYGLRPRKDSQISSWPKHAAHFLWTQGFAEQGK